MLKYEHKPGWERLLEKLEGYFDSQFEAGWKGRSGLSDW
jgi:hypothetical protein